MTLYLNIPFWHSIWHIETQNVEVHCLVESLFSYRFGSNRHIEYKWMTDLNHRNIWCSVLCSIFSACFVFHIISTMLVFLSVYLTFDSVWGHWGKGTNLKRSKKWISPFQTSYCTSYNLCVEVQQPFIFCCQGASVFIRCAFASAASAFSVMFRSSIQSSTALFPDIPSNRNSTFFARVALLNFLGLV